MYRNRKTDDDGASSRGGRERPQTPASIAARGRLGRRDAGRGEPRLARDGPWRAGLRLVALLAAASLALPAGCQENGDAPNAVACTDFVLGADLLSVSWAQGQDGGSAGQAATDFAVYAQACADVGAAAAAVVRDVTAACADLAADLGGSALAPSSPDPVARLRGYCELAARLVASAAHGKLLLAVQPPSCSFFAPAQACCEASCLGETMCSGSSPCDVQLDDLASRCAGDQTAGDCAGTCAGPCVGSADEAVACAARCDGECDGACAGACASLAGGACRGPCTGACTGRCRGTCGPPAHAGAACDAECQGGCSAALAAPRCKVELLPPPAACQGSAQCMTSCRASAMAAATCAESAVSVAGLAGASQQAAASLALHLPPLLQAASSKGRGGLLSADAAALVALEPTATSAAGSLSIHASVCAGPAGSAAVTAVQGLSAAFTEAGKVLVAAGRPPS